jgi:glutathione peroxidase
MKLGAGGSKGKVLLRPNVLVSVPIPKELSFMLNDGTSFSPGEERGKYILLVNTASDCGFTEQYAELQKLHIQHADKLSLVGIPSNDFKQQERGNDAEIVQFCSINYGVSFPLAKKTIVSKGVNQHPIYEWLSNSTLNGWNDQAPDWNFSKYLLSPDGHLLAYWGPAVAPSVCTELLR